MTETIRFNEFMDLRKYAANTKKMYNVYYRLFKSYAPLTSANAQFFILDHNNSMARAFLRCYSDFLKLNIEIPQIKGKLKRSLPKTLSRDEVRLIMRHANFELSVIIHLMYECGLRIQETLDLTRSGIDLINHKISGLGKGNKEFKRTISENLGFKLDRLCYNLLPEDKIFSSWNQNKVYYRLRVIGRKHLGKNIHPHMFRHSMATELLKNGTNLRAVQAFLRHASLNTVQIYTHVVEEDYINSVQEILN